MRIRQYKSASAGVVLHTALHALAASGRSTPISAAIAAPARRKGTHCVSGQPFSMTYGPSSAMAKNGKLNGLRQMPVSATANPVLNAPFGRLRDVPKKAAPTADVESAQLLRNLHGGPWP